MVFLLYHEIPREFAISATLWGCIGVPNDLKSHKQQLKYCKVGQNEHVYNEKLRKIKKFKCLYTQHHATTDL